MTDKLGQAEEEPYNGWVLRNVYFENGEPLMHSEPESKRLQELATTTSNLVDEIHRLQELADYRLKLLTKMPSEWVGLTDDDLHELFMSNDYIDDSVVFEVIARAIEAKLKEKNCA